jgi:glycosyltransferase involved in cell wall biosynthesis
MLLLTLLLVSVPLFVLLASLAGMIRGARSIPRVEPGRSTPFRGNPPRVSVIVPARNEETRIGDCLRTLLAQDYPDLEIVVVDDCSTDRTGPMVSEAAGRDSRVVLIQGQPIPPGWLGKPHAIWQGVQRATGQLLCFVDADGRLHPECLRQAVFCLEEHRADLLTLGMRLECPSFWERAVQPLILQLILMGFPAEKVNDPNSQVASANGPFLLFRRSAYEAIGGHQAVKAEIVEDLLLARRIKRQGLRLLWVLGPELMSLRMYPSLKDLWEGWSKNFFKSLDEKISLAVLTGLGVVWLFLLPWLSFVWSGWRLAAGPDRLSVLAVFLLSAATLLVHGVQRVWISSVYRLGASGLYLQPLGAMVLLGILVNSAVKTRRGGAISWKGRVYPGGKASG